MRLYRTALRLYPAPFRARFGDEMLQLYRDARAYGGRPPLVRGVLPSAPPPWGGGGAQGLLCLFAVVVARTGRRGAEFDYSSRRLRWWWIPAGLIGAAEGAFGIGQIITDPKWENGVALVILSGFAALVFGGISIRNRRAGNWMIAFGVAPMLPAFWMVVPPIMAIVVIVAAM